MSLPSPSRWFEVGQLVAVTICAPLGSRTSANTRAARREKKNILPRRKSWGRGIPSPLGVGGRVRREESGEEAGKVYSSAPGLRRWPSCPRSRAPPTRSDSSALILPPLWLCSCAARRGELGVKAWLARWGEGLVCVASDGWPAERKHSAGDERMWKRTDGTEPVWPRPACSCAASTAFILLPGPSMAD